MLGRLVQYLNHLRAQRLHEPLTAEWLQAINRNEALKVTRVPVRPCFPARGG